MFRLIASDNFEPFGSFRWFLPPVENKPEDLAEVHLLTGVNGTGKSRLLSVVAAMLGYGDPLVRRNAGSSQGATFWATIRSDFRAIADRPLNQLSLSKNSCHWTRSDATPGWAQAIPSFAYSGTAYLRNEKVQPLVAAPKLELHSRLSFIRPPSEAGVLLQSLVNIKVQAALDLMNHGAERASGMRPAKLATALEATLSAITGSCIAFSIEYIPEIRLSVDWNGRRLSVEGLPEGLKTIIGWVVHALLMMDIQLQGKEDPRSKEAVFLLDEIEAHLHPAWQRRILPAFQRLFPKAQIFVASHSPFLIASLNHGWIHPLSVTNDGSVRLDEPRAASQGDSYLSVLEEVMGVTELYDPETEDLLSKFRTARDAAYTGTAGAVETARGLASQLARRSPELSFMMGKELSQMERQLKQASRAE